MTPAFCARCGAAVAAGARFCEQCGASLPVATAPVAPPPADPSPAKRRRAPYAIAVVAVIAVAAAAAVMLLRGGDTVNAVESDAAPGSRTPPGVTASGIDFPVGTQVGSLAASGDAVWLTTGGRKWGGLTRLAPGKPRFWPVPEWNENFGGGLLARDGGESWVLLDDRTIGLIRASGALERFPITDGDLESTGSVAATAPDGGLWIVTDEGRMLDVDERGGMEWSTVELPPAEDEDSCFLSGMTVESDGAFWLSDFGCDRVIRVVDGVGEAYDIDADDPEKNTSPGSILWTPDQRLLFVNSTSFGPRLGEITIDHTVTPIIAQDEGDLFPGALFAGRTGDTWMTFGQVCQAGHLVGSDISTLQTPFPAQSIQPGADGDLWVAGNTRVAHIPAAGAGNPADCDVTEPELKILAFEGGSLSLDELERDGLVMDVNEPALLYVDLIFSDDGEPGNFGTVDGQRILAKRGRVTIDIPPEFIERAREHLQNGTRPTLMSLSLARDASGNDGYGSDVPGTSVYLTE